MALRILNFIFGISLAFGITHQSQIKDLPFDVNEVINQVPLLNGEFLIDTNVVYVSAPGVQYHSSVAFNGTNYLVVWEVYYSPFDSDIYGARVSQSGEILDPIGIPIAIAINQQDYPSVACDGSNYLVVWEDYRRPYSSSIYGTMVNQYGVVLDTNGVAISIAPNDQKYPSIVFDGTNYLVVWQDHRSGSSIYGARVNQSGEIIDPEGIAISSETQWTGPPSIAFNGTNYFVVWHNYQSDTVDIYGARVNSSGILLDTAGITISTAPNDQMYPSITFGETNYLVVWEDYRHNPNEPDIYGARINQVGTVLDTVGIMISNAANDQKYPSVTFDGTNYFVVWQDFRRSTYDSDIYGARISQSGVVIDSGGIALSTVTGMEYEPIVTFDGLNYFIVWENSKNGDPDIYGARVSQSTVIIDTNGFAISMIANRQISPTIAFDRNNYLVVWEEGPSGRADIYGTRISQSGRILDTSCIAISTASNDQKCPSITFDGTNYLVVWQDRRSDTFDIYGARINQSGGVIDTEGFVITTAPQNQFSPSIAFDGANYFVVWENHYSGNSEIYGVRINQSGSVLDSTPIAVSSPRNREFTPTVGFDGTNYLVVWEDWTNSTFDIYGSRVSQMGVVLDTIHIAIVIADDFQSFPSIAFDGTNYFVVWEDWRGPHSNIYGARVSHSGVVLDTNGFALSSIANGQYSPSVAFDGINYLVVWTDDRSGYEQPDIYGAQVSPSGMVIDSFPVAIQSGSQLSPVLAHGVGNQFLITYSGWADSVNHHPANTMRIWGDFGPFGGIEEEKLKLKMKSANLLEVYPNPAKKVIRVRGPLSGKKEEVIKIFDVSGKLVKEEKITNAQEHKHEIKISLKGINPGIYFLQLGTEIRKFLVVR